MRPLMSNEFRHSKTFVLVLLAVLMASTAVCAAAAGGESSGIPGELTAILRLQIVLLPIYLGMSLPSYSFRGENRGNTWRLLKSLPATGSTVVTAKYAAAGLALAGGLAASLVGLTLADGHGDFRQAAAALALPAIVAITLLSINFWLRFWLGERHATTALIVLLVAFQLLGVVTLLVMPSLGGGLKGFLLSIETWAAWAAVAPGIFVTALGAGLICAACWLVSVRIYDGRDINSTM